MITKSQAPFGNCGGRDEKQCERPGERGELMARNL